VRKDSQKRVRRKGESESRGAGDQHEGYGLEASQTMRTTKMQRGRGGYSRGESPRGLWHIGVVIVRRSVVHGKVVSKQFGRPQRKKKRVRGLGNCVDRFILIK